MIGFAVLVWTIFPADKASNQNTATLELKNGDALQKKTAAAVTSNDKMSTVISKKSTENIAANTTIITQQKGIDKNNAVLISPSIENNDRNIHSLSAQNNTDAASRSMKREEIISNPVDAGEKTQFSQKTPSANATLANTDMVKVAHSEETDNTEHIAQQTVYKELDTDDEKKSLYLGSLEINKDKLRGFFRKAGSLFRGKAKQQEEDRTESTTPSNTRSLK